MLQLKTNKRDYIIFFVVVGAFIACIVWGRWDVADKHRFLQVKSSSLKDDLLKDQIESELNTVIEVKSGKSSYFFGSDWGVIRIYVCRKNDAAMDSFTGLEYFFVYKLDGWEETDTARIDLPVHIYEGYQKLENAGHRVDAKAYERYKN